MQDITRITIRSVSGYFDKENDIVVAGFAEGLDGSGLTMVFQCELLAEDPWVGDPATTDYFSNSYCVTLGSGETVYGQLERVCFSGAQGSFHFSDHAADILGLGRPLVLNFKVFQQELQSFQELFLRIVKWGAPSQIPEFIGFN
ncbi:immunity protein 7-domain-containing protein [Penicillium malachiteum]|nr:immunity protein 7-domain-containing protein [Penicillium malachiteum]